MKQKYRRIFRSLFLNWKELLFFQFFFSLCTLILLYHIGSFFMQISLRFSSYSYLTVQNAIPFLLSPVTLICLLILLSILFILVYYNTCITLTGFQASVAGFRIGFFQMVSSGFFKGFYAFRPRFLLAAVPLLSFFLVSNLYFIYQLFYRVNPFCTYLPIFLDYIGFRIGLIFLIPFSTIYSFFHLFDFCFTFLGRDCIRDSKQKSRQIFLKHPLTIIGLLAGSTIIMAAFWHLLRTCITILAAFFISVFVAADIQVALILTLDYYITLITLFLSLTLGSLLSTGFITKIFYRYSHYRAREHVVVYHKTISPRSRRFLFPLLICISSTAIISYFYFGIYKGAIQSERMTPFIQIAAHRGVSLEAPENTLPAIELAIDYLSDYVEIDVQCTKDGELVVFHDSSLKRVTGQSRALADVTFEELQLLDAGSFFHSRFANTRIPTFEEVLTLANGKVHLLVELKRTKTGDDLAEKVLSLIHEYGMEHQCIIQSSDYQYVSQVKTLNPDMTVGYILSTAIGNYYTNEKIDFFSVRSAFITQSTVNGIHAAGKKVFAWTVNTRAEMERMKRIQVDAIITDNPILAREVLYREDDNDSLMRIIKLILQ